MSACALSILAVLAAVEGGVPRIESLLPVGGIRAEVLRLTAPEPYPTLVVRFQEAAREHGPWLLEWVKQAGPGPLPWHPNLGLSKAEYETFLALQEQLRFEAEREVTISVTEKAGWIVLDGGDQLPELWDVELDPRSMSLRTPLGSCASFKAVEPSPKQKATGPWRGFTCSRSAGDPVKGDAESVTFNVGRLADTGKVFLSYTAKRMRGPGTLERADVYLRYRTQ